MLAIIGDEVAARREAVGMTQQELGAYTHCSRKTVGSYEQGPLVPPRYFIELADTALDAAGSIVRLWRRLNDDAIPDWFFWYSRMEAMATEIRHFEANLIPGLLQTEGYAEAVFNVLQPPPTKNHLERQIAVRVGRQHILTREDPPVTWFVLDEAMFQRWPLDRSVVQPQLRHIMDVAALPNVVIQVLPCRSGLHPAPHGLMTYLSFAEADDAGYVEPFGGGSIISDPTTLANMRRTYDVLRAEALSASATEKFLSNLLEQV